MLAIIPARGGSKGLPGKNIKELNGKPLLAYTAEAALKSKSITRAIISTDDEGIANIAIKNGLECPFMRPNHLATDDAKAIDVYNYTLDKICEDEKIEINEFVVLQPTSPLRTSIHIDEAIDLFFKKRADSILSYCQEHHPISWHKYINENGSFDEIFDENNQLKNRQDHRMSYFPNGAVYVFSRELIKMKEYYSDRSYAYIMKKEDSVDIDTRFDWLIAEQLLKNSK
ncbi:N-acylneuraminate cytidylyltransferase [Aquimarina aggregata]|uniref:N-acylneuraminate cytidylyltransferase n=1 Tax=Aquimarina aggregata TaxID=1642818 RepID=A0A163BIX6_9FLAO|nr:acylneuraminate cytidylyltransferase family protein [Aquimarina aggregata]KZS41445.1 N-acylneuraminate cytidylyltransferase [Aquimarina aggregata]